MTIKRLIKLLGIGILSQLLFLLFVLLMALLFSPIASIGIEIPTSWFYLICSLLFLGVIWFVHEKSKKEVIWRTFLFGFIPALIYAIFYIVIPSFQVEITSGWSDVRIFTINPFKIYSISILEFSIFPSPLFVPTDIFYLISVIITVLAFLLSLYPLIKKFGHCYLPASISAIFFMLGVILFFDFLDYSVSGSIGIAGAYVPLLLSGVLLLNYFAVKEYSNSVLIRTFVIFLLFLSFGIIQFCGFGHLPLLWSPIDFGCFCMIGGGCFGSIVIFYGIFTFPLPIDCLEAYILSWIATIIYWILLSRLIVFSYDKL